MNLVTWIGIVLCISQSALFSGLNLAIFSISRLRLEVKSAGGSREASRVLMLRRHFNFTLATVLWGNVCVNVLLTLLSDSVLTGVEAFFFSTVAITFAGEILPQAYFSRHALRMASLLFPFLRLYQVLLYPVTKPTAWILDRWLGPEAIALFQEKEFRVLINRHVEATGGDVSRVEGIGAVNFLDLDDIAVTDEGAPVDPHSIISLPLQQGWPVLPTFRCSADDPFLRQVNASGKKWVIITDSSGYPQRVLDAHRFLRAALFGGPGISPQTYWHRPIVVTDAQARLGDVIGLLKVRSSDPEDDVITQDLILIWGAEKRMITGGDILGRLLRGIAAREISEQAIAPAQMKVAQRTAAEGVRSGSPSTACGSGRSNDLKGMNKDR
jgi:metal transporter CNNM